jgi:hypothetical protein
MSLFEEAATVKTLVSETISNRNVYRTSWTTVEIGDVGNPDFLTSALYVRRRYERIKDTRGRLPFVSSPNI